MACWHHLPDSCLLIWQVPSLTQTLCCVKSVESPGSQNNMVETPYVHFLLGTKIKEGNNPCVPFSPPLTVKGSGNDNAHSSKGGGRGLQRFWNPGWQIQADGVPNFFHFSQGMLCVHTSLLFSEIIPLSSWFQPLDFGCCLWVILPVSKEWYVLSRWL